jgi:hypothetical protein
MTVKELKERIKDLPDDMEVVINEPEYVSDDPYCGVELRSVDATPIKDENVFIQHTTWHGKETDLLTFGFYK